ncbi:MAG: hypothetical protein NZ551_12015 [Microscillaceae bacterium]|nr:hypothetical protein [Microscillaceae bacterium]MDW8461920.1 hypothetical protein [Cytophagales bacterium]
MAKLKSIIKQLSENDYKKIYQQLLESNAEKSAQLLRLMYKEQLPDTKIMQELSVNTNAYYTLRSRLNQKIEEYLLEQIESPRTDLLRKVANIYEIIFTKKRTIAIATLKKMEKELLDYDLSNELMIVYKTLKKLHINTPEYFEYSQLYNKHVAYTLAVDKVENLLAEYFQKYGYYSFTNDEQGKLELSLLTKEINYNCKMYRSHRLYVYQSCVNVFHRLFVEAETEDQENEENNEAIEDIFLKVESYFNMYPLDSTYHHLRIVLEFLRLEYYNYYKLYRKAENYFDIVNDSISSLMSSYNFYIYPARFLLTKLERHLRLNTQHTLSEENEGLFHDFEPDVQNIPQYVTYVVYRALSFYYANKYEEASKQINNLLNSVSLKRFPFVLLEIKVFLAVLYHIRKEQDLLEQLSHSIQRQIRLLGKEVCTQPLLIMKIIKTASSTSKSERESRILGYIDRLKKLSTQGFSVCKYLKMDNDLLKRIL